MNQCKALIVHPFANNKYSIGCDPIDNSGSHSAIVFKRGRTMWLSVFTLMMDYFNSVEWQKDDGNSIGKLIKESDSIITTQYLTKKQIEEIYGRKM